MRNLFPKIDKAVDRAGYWQPVVRWLWTYAAGSAVMSFLGASWGALSEHGWAAVILFGIASALAILLILSVMAVLFAVAWRKIYPAEASADRSLPTDPDEEEDAEYALVVGRLASLIQSTDAELREEISEVRKLVRELHRIDGEAIAELHKADRDFAAAMAEEKEEAKRTIDARYDYTRGTTDDLESQLSDVQRELAVLRGEQGSRQPEVDMETWLERIRTDLGDAIGRHERSIDNLEYRLRYTTSLLTTWIAPELRAAAKQVMRHIEMSEPLDLASFKSDTECWNKLFHVFVRLFAMYDADVQSKLRPNFNSQDMGEGSLRKRGITLHPAIALETLAQKWAGHPHELFRAQVFFAEHQAFQRFKDDDPRSFDILMGDYASRAPL